MEGEPFSKCGSRLSAAHMSKCGSRLSACARVSRVPMINIPEMLFWKDAALRGATVTLVRGVE
eukprot:5111889-Pyramimonas_sp.AAC.1